jgi:RNA polymerase sigma-70 factor (ECF subfamily)
VTLSLSECDDRELVSLATSGQQQAFREILSRHKAQIFRLVRNTIGDSEAAADLVQETFVSAFAAIDRYDKDRPFKFWLSRIALNKCRDWARRRTVRSFFSFAQTIDIADDFESDAPDPHQEAVGKAELARVEKAIAQLPHNLREVIVLRGVEDLSQGETAKILGISQKAVETRLYRARTQLKTLLAGTFEPETIHQHEPKNAANHD